jgi:hypothetical protein
MRNQEVDRVATALERTDGRDISAITRQVEELQRNPASWARERQAINDRVDMRRLGFAGNDDIQIMGANNGQLITRSSDGRSEQVRDGRTGAVVSERRTPEGRVTPNGERDFRDQGDGSTRYTIRPGDTLSHIARQRLRAETGSEPSLRDIHEQVQAIGQANRLRDTNNVRVGTELTIPSIRDRARPEASRGVGDTNPGLTPSAENYHPMRLPGQVEPGRENGARWREGERTNDYTAPAGERNVRTYDAPVRNGTYLFSSPPTAQVMQETDRRTGEIVRSNVRYSGEGIDMSVRDQYGTRQLQGVRSAETVMDPRTGNYTTTIATGDGNNHVIATDRTGRVTAWVTRRQEQR